MIICGIDPGLSGAICILDSKHTITVQDMPTLALTRGGKNKREIDAAALVTILKAWPVDHVFMELVNSMPGQGVASMFAFGKAFGIVIGEIAALGLVYTLVSSRRWKPALGVPAAKDGARARASQLLPHAASNWPLVKHDGRAEAALIALYGLRYLRVERNDAA